MKSSLLVICLGFLIVSLVEAKKLTEEDCEVCVKVIKKFDADLPDDVRSKTDKIEQRFKDFCKTAKDKEERFCYAVGGSPTSATSILKQISQPLSYHKPALKICEQLKAQDAQICELKYEKQINFLEVDFKKLKVKDLKKILSNWGEDKACKGCTEKADFVRVVKQLLSKYEPEVAKKLQERDEL